MQELSLILVQNSLEKFNLNVDAEMMHKYFKQLQLSEASLNTYKNSLIVFFNWLEDRELNEDTLLDYRAYLISKYKASSINTHISAVKSFFNYLEKHGATNYAKCLKNVKVNAKVHKRDSLTKQQVKLILNSIDRNGIKGARDYAIITLMLFTGLRQCEVVNAKVGDIQEEGCKHILLVQGKGYNETIDNTADKVELKDTVYNALMNYLAYRGNCEMNEPLFTSTSNYNNGSLEHLTTKSIRKLVKGMYKAVGIESTRLTTHSTRHTAITLSLLSGASVYAVKEMARHSNINTTMIYAHNLERLSNNNAESKLEEYLNN